MTVIVRCVSEPGEIGAITFHAPTELRTTTLRNCKSNSLYSVLCVEFVPGKKRKRVFPYPVFRREFIAPNTSRRQKEKRAPCAGVFVFCLIFFSPLRLCANALSRPPAAVLLNFSQPPVKSADMPPCVRPFGSCSSGYLVSCFPSFRAPSLSER